MHKLFSKSIKSRLLFSFALVISSVFLVFLVTYPLILNMFTEEIEKNTRERMQNALLRFDDNLSQIQQQIFSLNQNSVFKAIFSKKDITAYEQVELWSQANLKLMEIPYIEDFALVVRGEEDIITSGGVFTFEKYFGKYWSNDEYNVDFWKKQLYQPFSIMYYPQSEYTSHAFFQGDVKTVLPIAFKNAFDNRYMVILFIDLQSMCRSIDPYILENLSVYYRGTPLILQAGQEPMDYEPYLQGGSSAFEKIGDNYAGISRSAFNDFIYVKNTPVNEISSVLNTIYGFCFLIILLALLLSATVVVVITKKLYRPFNSITQVLKENQFVNEKGGDELTFIEANLHQLLDEKKQTARELEEKNRMLSSFLYQSKLKNIYMNIQNDNADEANDNQLSYYLLSFQIYYRDDVSELVNKSYNELSFILKEHIQSVLKHYFPSLLLFQPEENCFFANVGLSLQENRLEAIMQKVMKRLANEEEYCYFHVAVSGLIEEESQLTEYYDSIVELQQQFCLEERSQLLFYEKQPQGRGYVSITPQQESSLKQMILDSDEKGARALVNQILSAGLTEKATFLSASLFCSSLINTMLKALNEKYVSLPAELPVQAVCAQIPKCERSAQFKELLLGFLEEVIQYGMEGGGADPVIEGAKQYVAAHYSEEFTMEMLAEQLKISKNYLSTYFKAKTGVNLLDYIQQYRIRKAVALMKTTGENIGTIGGLVGISNPNTFIRVFKKQTGMTPSEYRKKEIANNTKPSP